MDSLVVIGTNYTPQIEFTYHGNLSIAGRSLPEDTSKFYQPLLMWVTNCTLESVHLDVKLEYMNSSSAHQISKLLMIIKDNPFINECQVDWFYEPDDEDGLDFGMEMECITDFNFNFYQYAAIF